MNAGPVSLGAAGQKTEMLEAKVAALEILLAKVLSTIPPQQQNALFEAAKQQLLIHPKAAQVKQEIEEIQRRAN